MSTPAADAKRIFLRARTSSADQAGLQDHDLVDLFLTKAGSDKEDTGPAGVAPGFGIHGDLSLGEAMIAFLDTLSGLAKWLAGLSLQLIRKYTREMLK
ncbi:MAG: hypothetical protein Q9175_007177 [Cornicularia normoerica]